MANQKRYLLKAVLGQLVSGATQSGTSLNAAFTFGTSGTAYSARYFSAVASPIANVYVFMYSSGGTIANITMGADIRSERTSGTNMHLWPSTTVRETASAVIVPSANLKWIKAAFGGGSPYTPAIGEPLWLTFWNSSPSPTVDYPSIETAGGPPSGSRFQMVYGLIAVTTTGGFAAAGTQTGCAAVVIEHDDGTVVGLPWTKLNSTPYASNTRERGVVIGPLDGSQKVCGAEWLTSSSLFTNVKLYDNTTAPGGTALATESLDTDANATTLDRMGAKLFASDWTLAASTTYKSTLQFSSNATLPGAGQIEDYASYSSVFDACYDGVNFCYSVQDDGAGGWTPDKSLLPDFMLHVSEVPAAAGGGGPLIGGRLVR